MSGDFPIDPIPDSRLAKWRPDAHSQMNRDSDLRNTNRRGSYSSLEDAVCAVEEGSGAWTVILLLPCSPNRKTQWYCSQCVRDNSFRHIDYGTALSAYTYLIPIFCQIYQIVSL